MAGEIGKAECSISKIKDEASHRRRLDGSAFRF
jgi:hypothetical protein